MSAILLDGKSIARRIRESARVEIHKAGLAPGLGVILVGDDPASHLYVALKRKACAEAGIVFNERLLSAAATTEAVLAEVASFNARPDIHAILVQLPLPAQIDTDRVIAAIDPTKDVDGFHPENVAALRAEKPRIVPGLAASIMELISATGVDLNGKRALVIGNSLTFYEPLESVLASAGLAPDFRRADEPDLAQVTRAADVIVVAVGRAGFLSADMIKQDAIVIDVGTNRGSDGGTVGDCDPDVNSKAGWLSPVPGGVGPVTVAMLIKNTVMLAAKK